VNNWKVIFATVVIFGAGVITGGLLVNYVQHSYPKTPHRPAAAAEARPSVTNPAPHPADAAKPRLPEILSKQFLQRLDEELHLAPEQHEAIQKIIGDGQNQMRKVIQDARLEIREVLTPEQRRGFDELVKRPPRRPVSGTNAAPLLPAVTNAPAS
jgi:Spy/CpxP family protein refolding chaperone